MKTAVILILACAQLLSSPLHAEDYHFFTNESGQKIEARVVEKHANGEVTIEGRNGQTFTVDPGIFSEADQKHIAEWSPDVSSPEASAHEETGREVFVAVGYGGRRMISEDEGRTWEITEEWQVSGGDDFQNIMGLTWAEGRFVCVGGGGGGSFGTPGGHIHVSEDGRTWRKVMDARSRVNPIVYGKGRFVVGGPNRQQLMWSEDAETWEEGGIIEGQRATHWRKGAFGNDIFVFTGNNGGQSPCWIITTSDGTSIDSFYNEDLPSIRDLAFGNGRFVVVGGNGVRRSSADGVTWENHDVDAETTVTWVVWDGEQFLAGTKPVSRSIDGITWEDTSDLNLRGVKWTDGERFIMTGWPGKMSFSTDGGDSVEKANELTPNGINRVVRGYVAQ